MTYRIRQVDGADDDIAETIAELHELVFGTSAPKIDTDSGFWWLAYANKDPIAFAGLVPSTYGPGVGYLKRAGVLIEHRGNGLQKRLLRVREAKARRLGWTKLITDTTDNVPSGNNLIAVGFKLFAPSWPWSFPQSIYWTKELNA